MNLRTQACQDALAILEDQDNGSGWPIVVTNPDRDTLALVGFSQDIGQTVDPDTGQMVSGRQASVALPIARFKASGFDIPRNIEDESSKPWIVTFDDILGEARNFKVRETLPDRTIGLVVCILEVYADNSVDAVEIVTAVSGANVTRQSGEAVFA